MPLQIKCSLCQTPSALEKNFEDVFLYRCPACRHLFTDVSRLKSRETYDEKYYQHSHEAWNNNPNLSFYRQVVDKLKKENPESRLIDVGCGSGIFLKALKKFKVPFQLTGIDFMPPESEERIQYISGNFLTASHDKEFEILTNFQVIEHIDNPNEFLEKAKRAVVPGGVVVIDTINERGLVYIVAGWLDGLGMKTPYRRLHSRHHVNHFNVSSLSKAAERAGLKVESVYLHGEPLSAVDIPYRNPFIKGVMKLFLLGLFLGGALTGRPLFQTLFCRRPSDV